LDANIEVHGTGVTQLTGPRIFMMSVFEIAKLYGVQGLMASKADRQKDW
jgi:hypothetical protein